MKIKFKTLSLILLPILAMGVYWGLWAMGFPLASTKSNRIRYVIREIPFDKSPWAMVLDLNDAYLYRLECWNSWGWLLDCRSFSEDSYRAKKGSIGVSQEGAKYLLDDNHLATFNYGAGWIYGEGHLK